MGDLAAKAFEHELQEADGDSSSVPFIEGADIIDTDTIHTLLAESDNIEEPSSQQQPTQHAISDSNANSIKPSKPTEKHESTNSQILPASARTSVQSVAHADCSFSSSSSAQVEPKAHHASDSAVQPSTPSAVPGDFG